MGEFLKHVREELSKEFLNKSLIKYILESLQIIFEKFLGIPQLWLKKHLEENFKAFQEDSLVEFRM